MVKSFPDKFTQTNEEVKEHFRGPDTSSLSAFLISLFSCSASGLRCADDPISSDQDDARVLVSPTGTVEMKCQRQVGDSTANARTSVQQQRSSMVHRTNADHDEAEDSGTEWQLITDEDFQDSENCSSVSPKPSIALPDISDTSVILPESLRTSIYSDLPVLVQGREWVLLYSTWKHGISLRTLYRRSAYLSCPYLLVVEDSRGTVFGGFLSSSLNPTSKMKFQGTHETFVFTNISRNLQLFHPTGLNRYFFLCAHDALAFGGGGSFALHMDGELFHGSSGHSDTFGNCCLAHAEEFTVKHVELWGFAHSSKYVQPKDAFKEPMEAPGICRW